MFVIEESSALKLKKINILGIIRHDIICTIRHDIILLYILLNIIIKN